MRRMIDVEAAEIRKLAAMVSDLVKRHGSTEEAARETELGAGTLNHFRRLAKTRVNRTFSSDTIDKIKRAHAAT